MTDLRAALIEAGAQALDGRPLADLDGAASAVLDAVLDALADRADEPFNDLADMDIFGLIAVLRGDTE